MTRSVLITGARSAAALDLARDWARAGFTPELADSSPGLIARMSSLRARVHRYASPRGDRPQFRADILRLVDRFDPVLIVPTCEEVYHLAAPPLGPALGERLFAPSLDVLHRLHAKDRFPALCRSLGLEAPETVTLTSSAALSGFNSSSAEWVFKPVYSRFGSRALIGPSAPALSRVAPTAEQPWVAQRLVRGEEVCFYAVVADRSPKAFAAYRSPWRLDGGAGYAFAPIGGELEDQLRALARTLAFSLDLRGQIACDVIVDERGAPHLIECNPRSTSGVHLLAGDGRLARSMLGTAPDAGPFPGSRHLGPALWTYGVGAAIRSRRGREWRAQRAGGRDVIGVPGDRWPVLGALLDTGWFAARAVRRRSTLSQAMTADIEWNGEDLS
jgi:hypothetical protein